MNIRIILADDHNIMREGLRSLIEHEAGMEIIAEAENGRQAVELCREHHPDIVIMDVAMPDLNGVEATAQVLRHCPGTKVLALSTYKTQRFAAGMLAAGASGYVVKGSAFRQLIEAIEAVSRGNAYLSPEVTDAVVTDYAERLRLDDAQATHALTEREREIVQLVAEGNTTKGIAEALFISPKTVDSHRQNAMDKLNLHTVADLTRYAIREGLTPPDG